MEDDNKTLWCGNLPEQVTEELLYELFLQAGPLEKVRIARDRDGRQKNFGFITYSHEVSVAYAINLFRGTSLYHRTLSLQCRGRLALLPPPIRCYGPEPPIDFQHQPNVVKQFAELTDRLKDDYAMLNCPRQGHDLNNKLVQASLQGNWSRRHHPYRPQDNMHARDDHRSSHSQKNSRSKHSSGSWRDRRNHRGNYRRD